jgi:hypothetical protein
MGLFARLAGLIAPQEVASAVPTPPATGAVFYFDSNLSSWANKASSGASAPVSPNPTNKSITASSAAINTTDTIIALSGSIPANFLQVGTTYRITVSGTCTSTAANVSTFTLRIGPNGTTADTTITTATATAATSGTSIPFTATFLVTVRATGGVGAGSVIGSGQIVNSNTTGISSKGIGGGGATATVSANTTAANFITLSYKSAATTTTSTFQIALVELAKY